MVSSRKCIKYDFCLHVVANKQFYLLLRCDITKKKIICNQLIEFVFIFANWIGATLDKKGASVTWDSKSESEESMNADRLHLRQILLGHTAKENEYNVVEVSREKKICSIYIDTKLTPFYLFV